MVIINIEHFVSNYTDFNYMYLYKGYRPRLLPLVRSICRKSWFLSRKHISDGEQSKDEKLWIKGSHSKLYNSTEVQIPLRHGWAWKYICGSMRRRIYNSWFVYCFIICFNCLKVCDYKSFKKPNICIIDQWLHRVWSLKRQLFSFMK